jgi:hypothetical protein
MSMPQRLLALALLGTFVYAGRLPAAAPESAADPVRAAVTRGLPLLLKGAIGHMEQRTCFACHSQALPLLALTAAKPRGFAVDEKEIQKQLQFIADFLGRNRDNFRKGQGTGGQADTAGYALLTLEVGGWKPDETTAAVAEYLLLRDKEASYWHTTSHRPPSEASPFTTTYLALRGLRAFGTPEQQERIAARTRKARQWLLTTPAHDTEDRVFRLLGLKLVGAPEKAVRAAVRDLVQDQRKDGGWAQLSVGDSDAYATGSALVALHQGGGMLVSDPAYQRGLKFLIGSQLQDGSWLVRSRSKPFQTYFETGFPHGKDQFISSAASGWAATALALACEPAPLKSARK